MLSSKTKTQGSQGLDNALSNSVGYGIGLPKNVPSPRSAQSDQQAENGANNPASTLADYLYSFSDQSEITLQIIGDPAWLVQGEPKGITASAFQFGGFYSDGTVNPDVQQVVFAVNWNAPADYNNGSSGPYSGTGLMDVNASSTQGNSNNLSKSPTQASAAYTATEVKSTFSKGKFVQELKGNALKNLNPTQLANVTGRPTTASNTATPSQNQPQAGTRIPNLTISDNGSSISLADQLNPNLWDSVPNNSPVSAPNSATPAYAASTQPQSASEAPTSNGDILAIQSVQSNYNQSGGGFTPPQDAVAAIAKASGYTPEKLSPEAQQFVDYSNARQTMAPKDA